MGYLNSTKIICVPRNSKGMKTNDCNFAKMLLASSKYRIK